MNSLRPPWKAILIVALIAIAGGALRCIIGGRELLWLDELHTSWAVSGSIGNVAGRAADGNQPPLYFWLTWISVYLIGPSEFSMRAISILADVGTLGFSAWLTWRWTSSGIAAGLVACLIAVDSQFLYCSTEARPYALMQLLSVAQVYFFWRACWGSSATESGPSFQFAPYWGLVIVSTFLVYTHLTSIWLFVAESLFLTAGCLVGAIRSRSGRNSPDSIKTAAAVRLLTSGLAVAIASLPAIVQMTSVYQRRSNWDIISLIDRLWTETWMPLALWIALPTTCLALVYLVQRLFKSNSENSDPERKSESAQQSQPAKRLGWKLVFVFLWAIVPVCIITGLDYFDIAPLALPRYALVGAVAFPIFAGLMIGCLSNKIGQFALSLLIVITSGLQNPVFESALVGRELYQFRLEDWSSPIAELNAAGANHNYPLFLFANVIEDRAAFDNHEARFQDYLRFPIQGLYEADDIGREVIAGPTLAFTHFKDEHVRLVTEQGGAWILVRDRPEKQLVSEIADEIREKTAAAIGREASTINVTVRELPPSPVYWLLIDW